MTLGTNIDDDPHESKNGTEAVMPFEMFQKSCNQLIKNKFAGQPYAQFVSIPGMYTKFCHWNDAYESHLASMGDP